MVRNPIRPRSDSPRAALIAGLIALLALAGNPGRADDRDLLRTGTAKPYLFILLDTSASMNLKMGAGNLWAPGGADSPDSRLFQAKQALYEVFQNVEDVQFGFASFNQDKVRVTAKHWIYFTTDSMPAATPWDLDFPRPDSNGRLTGCPDFRNNSTGAAVPDGICDDDDGDGNPDVDTLVGNIDGDVLTFGPRFTTGITNPGLAGTCASPFNLAVTADRQRVQSFAIDQALTSVDTNSGSGNPGKVTANAAFWVKSGSNTYRLGVVGAGTLGSGNLTVTFTLERLTSNCNNNPRDFAAPAQVLIRTFRLDAHLNQVFIVDSTDSSGNPNSREGFAGLWDQNDVISTANFGIDHPFTGKGWEGNYDSNVGYAGDGSNLTNDDPYCVPPGSSSCFVSDNLKPVVQTCPRWPPYRPDPPSARPR